MGNLKLTTARRRGISIAALAVASLMLIDAVYQIGMHAKWRGWLPETLAAESTDNESATTQPADEETKKSKPPKVHAAIKKRNIFIKAPDKKSRPPLTGVLGKTAMFKVDDKVVYIEEGKSGHDIKVVSIKGYDVTIEWQEKEEKLNLFTEKSGGGGRSRPSRGPARGRPAEMKATATAPAPAAAEEKDRAMAREARMRAAALEAAMKTKMENSGGSITIETGGGEMVIINEP